MVMVASGNIDRLPPVDRMKYGVGRRYEEMVNVMTAPPSKEAAVLMDQIGGLLSRLTELKPSKHEKNVLVVLSRRGKCSGT